MEQVDQQSLKIRNSLKIGNYNNLNLLLLSFMDIIHYYRMMKHLSTILKLKSLSIMSFPGLCNLAVVAQTQTRILSLTHSGARGS